MLISPRLTSALAGVLAFLFASLLLSATVSAAPITVNVRVEGLTQTLLQPTEVTTTSAPVIKDGEHACSGTSAAGALQLATSGNWNGTWYSGLGYSVETIEGQSYPFTQPYYWSFWLDNKPASTGICEAELNSGDSVLFFPECFSETMGVCPPSPNPLGIEAPAVAEVGRPVVITVTSYANATGASSPAPGATVAAEAVSASTDSSGHATLAFPGPGKFTLHATAPGSVRTEATICVHAGNDGTCGTNVPPASSIAQTPVSSSGVLQSRSYVGPYALVADLTGIRDGHYYARKQAPRLLSGKLAAHASVTSISLRLRRTYGGRCWAYSGSRERLLRVRCRHGAFFHVASGGDSFSYLLPFRLPPGRYVLDVEARDAAGNRSTLARGTSRVVFYVR
jgi:hypothetical protein